MKTYLADIIPKIQRFSQKLDNTTMLTNNHWVVIDNNDNIKMVYIFRDNCELLISKNGLVSKAKWEYLGKEALLIDSSDGSYLFKHGFLDENILALKIDSNEEYVFLVNETKYGSELNSIESILEFLNSNYINSETKRSIQGQITIDLKNWSNTELSSGYKIDRETNGWSFTTGKFIEYRIQFPGEREGSIIYSSKNNHYSYSTYDKNMSFKKLDDCIESLKQYLNHC